MEETSVLKYVLDFDEKPAKDKLQSIKEDVTSVGESVKALTEQKTDTTTGDILTPGLNNKSEISSVLSEATTMVNAYNRSIRKMGQGLQEVLLSPFSMMSSQLVQLDETLTKFTKKHLTSQDFAKYNNRAAAQAAAISESREYASAALAGMNNPILKNRKVDPNLPFLRNLAVRMIEEDTTMNRSAMTLGSAAAFVGKTAQFRDAIRTMSGYHTVDDSVYMEAAKALLASSPQARSRFLDATGHLQRFKFSTKPIYSTNYDALPDNMRDVYMHRGVVEGKVSRGRNVRANQEVYQKLVDLADYGENHELVEMARELGLLTIGDHNRNAGQKGRKQKTGQMHWRQEATMDQFDALAGLTLKKLHEVRYGSPLYPRNPVDNPSHSKMIMELNEVLSVLGQERQLKPGLMKPEDIAHWGEYVQMNKNVDRSIVRSFKRPSLYVIPQTRIGQNGEMVFSDPKTAARTKERTRQGLGDKDNDNFVAINDSLFARLAGFSPADNNTFGHGTDATGQAIYGKPNILKISAANLRPTDRFGMPIQPSKGQKVTPTQELLAYTSIMGQGGMYGTGDDQERYVFAWPAAQGKGAYLMPKRRVDDVKRHFEEDLFMPSPLEGFDSRGPIISGNRERTSKLINNLRKGASPGTPLIEHGFRLPSIKAIDYEAVDKLFEGSGFGEVLKNQIIDGLAYGNPDYIPTSLQGRLWGAPGKFMLQRLSLADLFDKSGAFKNMAYNGTTNLNQLITPNADNGYGYSVWVPSLATRNLEVNKELLKPYGVETVQDLLANMKAGKYDATTAEQIRKSWLTDIMSNPDIMMTDSSVKNEDKFTVLPENMYRGMFGIAPNVQIPASRKDQYGRVLLTAPEAEKYMYNASAATYGPWVMKTNDEFETEKGTMAVSAADAINYPPSMIRMSDKLYKAKLDRYADKAWLREHFLSQDQFAYKLESNPAWLESQEARAIIESEKQAIKADLDSRQKYLITTKNNDVLAQMLPGAGNDRLIKAIGGGDIDPNSEVAQLFPELYTLENLKKWGFDTTQLYDEVGTLRDEFFVERNGKRVLDPTKYMFAPGWNHASAIAGRMPASPGTYGELINLAYQREKDNSKNMFMKAFHAVGNFDTDMAAVTPEGIQRMNTGDFDGDTIWLYAQMADDMLANLEAVNAPMDKAKAAAAKVRSAYDMVAQKQKLPNIYEKYYGDLAQEDDIGQIRASATLNAQGAQLIMGQATAGIRNILTYGDLSDDETARALQSLVEYYDLGTSEVMNMGLEPEVQSDLAKKYMMSHRTYNRLMQQITQEESSGEPKIDSLFKYRPGSLTSPRDLAVMEMQAVGRSAYGSDQGLRERVLKAVDRAYTPGTKLHGMADTVANLIVDSETGYRFWPQSEVEQLYSLIPDIKMEAQGNDDKLAEVTRIESFLNDYITKGPTLERMQSAASKGDALAEQADFLLKHQATDGEKAVHDQMMQMIQERRQAVLDVAKLQEETANANGLSVEDLVKLGRVQDTTKLDKFKTSWSVTSVEPFMDAERSKAAMLPFLKDVKSYTLDYTHDGHHVYTGLSSLRGVNDLDFGSYSSMAAKEREELLNQNVDSFDTLLGTFMHSGFEDFFSSIAKPLAEGKKISFISQEFTKGLRDKLANGMTTDNEGHATSWRKMFDNIGINIDDIISGFTNEDAMGNAAFGPSIQALKNSQGARAKLEKIFGIEYAPGPDGKTHRYNGVGLPERLLTSWFDEYEHDPAQRIKRVVATENKIFDKSGNVIDVSKFADALPIDLPSVFGDRYVHAKPDLVYEGEDGRFHMMDYKSSSKGAVQALYQNAIYAEMLRKLGQASYEGYYEDGRAVPESLRKNLEVYRQFVEPDIETGEKVYKSKIDTVQSFDLETGRKNVVRIDEDGIKAVYNEYLNGIRNKADKLKKGYIEGKTLMFDRGELSSFAANPERMIDEFQEVEQLANNVEFRDDKNAARRQFLVEQFRQDQDALSEARSNLYKYQKQYGMIGKSFSINKFAPLISAVEGGLSKEAMAAMYAEYEGSPEIQKIIADQIEGKAGAREDLYSVIREAAVKDSALAKDRLTSMVVGKDTSSSAMSLIDSIDKEVAMARGSLLALKDKDSWDDARGWRDKDETIDLSKLKNETEEEKKIYAAAEAFNKREADRLMHATQNKAAYEVGELNFNTLLTEVPKLKDRAFESELKHEKSELDGILRDGDPYQNLMNAIDKRETEVADYILAKKLKINQLQQKLDAKDDKGKYLVSDTNDRNNIQNLIDTLNSNVTQAEGKIGKSGEEIIQQQLERLGMDTKTPQERAKEWVDQRQAAIRAKTNQDRQRIIDDYNKAEAEQEKIRADLREKYPDGQITIDELLSQDESARLKQERNRRLNELSARGANQLSVYQNLGADLQKQLEDQEVLQLKRADLLTSGGALSRDDRIKELTAKRFENIFKIGQSLPIEQQATYWASHRYSDIENQVKQEFSTSEDMLAKQLDYNQLLNVQREEQSQRQFEYAREDFNRQRRQRYGMSIIERSYMPYIQRKEQLQRQIDSLQGEHGQIAVASARKDIAFSALLNNAELKPLLEGKSKEEQEELLKNYKPQSESTEKALTNYRNAESEVNRLNGLLANSQSELSNIGGIGSAAFDAIGASVNRLAMRLGRRLFMKALQETKQFIKQFDASMNEIQAITLKSDQEMQGIRSQTIGKAIGLRTSVSNVSNVEAALYRQGLSDQEVSSRTDSIIKFATVTKLNVQEATKIITTALQNDLVESATAAMDALVALGDSAATTAAEIGKGMQKAAASAKVAGVSYEELTSLLTIGTSDTQLSGTQVGTALQTVFTRMRRLSLTGYTADQNGEKTTASDAEAALKAIGVDLYDDKSIGKMRSAYDVMLDLSRVWQNLSDAQKSIVTNALAGTRQTNIFSTMMEGMSEDGGKTLEKYLGLAEDSEGITQSKYEIAMQSLSAAMDEVKSSWDSVVESMVSGGSITGTLDSFSGFLQMFANANGLSQGFSVVVGGIAGITTALILANTALNPIAGLLGLVVGVATGGWLAGAGSLLNPKEITQEQRNQWAMSDISNARKASEAKNTEINSLIEDVEKAGKAWENSATSANTDKLTASLRSLQSVFPGVAEEALSSAEGLSQWTKAVEKAREEANRLTKEGRENVIKQTEKYVATNLGYDYQQYMDKRFMSVDKRDSIKQSFSEALGYKEGGLLYGRYTLDDILALDERPDLQARALTEAYRYRGNKDFKNFADLYLDEDVKAILEDETRDKPWEDAEFVQKGSGSLKYLADKLNAVDPYALESSVNSALAYRNDRVPGLERFISNGVLNFSSISSDRDRAFVFANALLGSSDLQNWTASQVQDDEIFKELIGDVQDPSTAISNNKQRLTDLFNKYSDYVNSDNKRIATRAFLETKLSDVMGESFAMMANDQFDTDKVKEIFVASLAKEMESDNFFTTDGDYDQTKIDQFVNNFLHGWLDNTSGYLNEQAAETMSAANFTYHFDENDSKSWFDNYEKAIEYANEKGIDLDSMKLANGESAYQGVQKLFGAKRIEANANNEAKIIDEILNGSTVDLTKLSEEYQQKLAEDFSSEDALQKIQNGEIKYTDLSEKAQARLGVKKLSEYKDFSELFTGYDNAGKSSVLANYIAGNAEAAMAVLADDYATFTSIIESAEPGVSTPKSSADIMRSFISIFGGKNGKENIGIFRSEPLLEKAYQNWRSFFGDNADAMLNAMAAGTFEGSELQEQANKILAEKGIMPGVGKQFTGIQAANMAKQVLDIGNWAQAQQELGWTTDEWSAISNKYPDLQRYLEMSEEQKSSQEGQNLRRNLEIQFNVAGISDLEEAGIVLDGLTEKLTNLQKGGEFAIKARLDIENEGYQINQLGAQLNSSNRREQIEAIQQLTGRSATQIQNDYQGSLEQAQAMQKLNTLQLGATLDEMYKGAPYDQKALIDEIAAGLGFERVLRKNADGSYSYGSNKYVRNSEDEKQYREDLLANAERRYSATDIARARQRILEGTLTHETEGEYDLYSAAVNELGFYGREYDRLKREGVTGSQLENAKRLAEAENAEASRIAQEQQALEDAKLLSGTSIAATNNYAQLQYNQQNKAGLAANRLYEAISGEGIKSFEDFNELLAGRGLQDWKELIESAGPELTKRFKDLGISIGPDGLDVSSIENAGGDVAAALEQVAQIIAERSESFSEYKPVETTQDQINKATAFINGIDQSKEAIEAYSSLVGDSDLTQIRTNGYKEYDIYAKNFAQEQRSYGVPENYIQEDINTMRPGWIQNYIQNQLSNNLDRRYQTAVERNAILGIQGLTDIDKYEGLMDIVNAIRSGASLSGENGIRTGARTQAYKAFTSSMEGADNWLSATEILQQNDTSWENLTEDKYNKLPDAFKNIYDSYEKAIEANTNFEEGIKKLDASLKISSDYLDDYNTGLDKNSKNAKTAANAQVKYNQTISSIRTSQYYRQQYRKGSRSGEILDQIASMTGKQKSDVGKKDNQKEIEEQLKEQEQQQLDQLNTMLAGEQEEWTDEINEFISSHPIDIEAEGVQVNIDTGTITVSSDYEHLADMVGADVAAQMQAYVAQLNGQGFDSEIQLFQDGSGAWHGRVVATTLGEGSKGGGGGGGGGKSPLDKLLEEQKYEISDIQHRVNMNDIETTHAGRMNNDEGYLAGIQKDIALRQEWIDVLDKQIAKLLEYIKTVKKGSPEEKKAVQALQSAQEERAKKNDEMIDSLKKKTDYKLKQQEYEDYKRDTEYSFIDTYAQAAMSQNRFSDYEAYSLAKQENLRGQINTNLLQEQEVIAEMAKYEEDSDEYRETYKKLLEIRMDSATKENQMIEEEQNLIRERINQIAKTLQYNDMTNMSFENRASIMASVYQSGGYMDQYREAINKQIGYKQSSLENTTKARDDAMAEVERIKNNPNLYGAMAYPYYSEQGIGSAASVDASMLTDHPNVDVYYEAVQAVYTYDEGIVQTTADLEELKTALTEADIKEIDDKLTDATMALEAKRNQTRGLMEEAKELRDYDNYNKLALQFVEENARIANEKRNAANEILAQIQSGELTPEQLRQQTQKYYSLMGESEDLERENRRQEREDQREKNSQILEDISQRSENYNHNMSLVQYEETRYQNNGEITNLNKIIGQENDLRQHRGEQIQKDIELVKDQIEATKDDAEETERLTKKLKELEEEEIKNNNEIEKNNKTIKENIQKIRQLQIAVEKTVDSEIEKQKKTQREMLNARVNMENQILDVIRKNEQEKWNLTRKSLEEERKALNERKKNIDEEMNYKRKMLDQENKYEELAELQKQLALIEADPTRSKDAREIRKRIEDLHKEISMTKYEDEAQAEKERIDEELEGIAKYEEKGEKDLQDRLADANNFREQIYNLLESDDEQGFEDFMKEINTTYKNATEAQRKQMEDGWKDTWKTMKHILENNGKAIADILASEDSYLNYMMGSDEYQNAENDNKRNSLIYNWSKAYEDWQAGIKDTAALVNLHDHQIVNGNGEMDEIINKAYDTNVNGKSREAPEFQEGVKYDTQYQNDVVSYLQDIVDIMKAPAGKAKEIIPDNVGESTAQPESGGSNGSQSKPASGTKNKYYVDNLMAIAAGQKEFATKEEAMKYAESLPGGAVVYDKDNVYYDSGRDEDLYKNIKKHATGGLVDYTGLAWVDGTKSKPEAFLSAIDVENIRALTKALSYVTVPSFNLPNLDSINGNSQTVGDINITINQAELKSDADYEEVARKVGQAFTKQLSKEGFNLRSYAF